MKYKGTISDPKDLVTKEWVEAQTPTVPIATTTSTGVVQVGDGLNVTSEGVLSVGMAQSVAFTTTAPTEANTDGIKIVKLTEEPATRYDGWLYIIVEEA